MAVGLAVGVLSAAGLVPLAAGPAAAVGDCTVRGAAPAADFDGDSFPDLVISDPAATVGTAAGAGAVEVRSGDATGQGGGAVTRITQGAGGAGETAEPGDGFGGAVEWGLVDGDFCADLIVGVPGEDIGTAVDSGLVEVIWGSATGLGRGRAPLLLRPGLAGIGTSPVSGDRMGSALALTDFAGVVVPAGTPRSIAMGMPGRAISGLAQAGEVDVVSISSAGAVTDPRRISQSSIGVAGNIGAGSRFGAAVAFGSLGGSSTRWKQDLLVGTPGSRGAAGAVITVFDRAAAGYAGQEWTQDTAGIGDAAESGDGFGSALSTVVDGFTGVTAVAIGVPGEDVGTVVDAGQVHVLEDGAGGAVGGRFLDRVVNQNTTGVEDVAERGDRFGAVLQQQFIQDQTTFRALVVGIPDEDVGTVVDAGAVELLSEYELGGPMANDVFVTAASTGVPGDPQRGAKFGADIRTRGASTGTELLIGVPDSTTWPTGAVIRYPTVTLFGRSTRAGAVLLPAVAGGDRYGRIIP